MAGNNPCFFSLPYSISLHHTQSQTLNLFLLLYYYIFFYIYTASTASQRPPHPAMAQPDQRPASVQTCQPASPAMARVSHSTATNRHPSCLLQGKAPQQFGQIKFTLTLSPCLYYTYRFIWRVGTALAYMYIHNKLINVNSIWHTIYFCRRHTPLPSGGKHVTSV